MIEMTFDEYDGIVAKINALDSSIKESIPIPDIDDVESYMDTKEGMVIIITAMEVSDDPDYTKEINRLLTKHLHLVEGGIAEDDEKKDDNADSDEDMPQNARNKKIKQRVNTLNFVMPAFCPSIEELDEIYKDYNIKKDNAALAFLYWVSDLEKDPDAGNEVKKVSKYARKLIRDSSAGRKSR